MRIAKSNSYVYTKNKSQTAVSTIWPPEMIIKTYLQRKYPHLQLFVITIPAFFNSQFINHDSNRYCNLMVSALSAKTSPGIKVWSSFESSTFLAVASEFSLTVILAICVISFDVF